MRRLTYCGVDEEHFVKTFRFKCYSVSRNSISMIVTTPFDYNNIYIHGFLHGSLVDGHEVCNLTLL